MAAIVFLIAVALFFARAPGRIERGTLSGVAPESARPTVRVSVLQERDSVWVVRDGTLNALAPKSLGRTDAGWMVQAFDAGEGVVVGTLPGAREGLMVTATDAAEMSN